MDRDKIIKKLDKLKAEHPEQKKSLWKRQKVQLI